MCNLASFERMNESIAGAKHVFDNVMSALSFFVVIQMVILCEEMIIIWEFNLKENTILKYKYVNLHGMV